MRKVFQILSAAVVFFALIMLKVDINAGSFNEDSVLALLFLGVIAAFFAFLAHLWRDKSPVRRAKEQAGKAADALKERQEVYRSYSRALKARVWKYRIVGILICALALWIWIAGDWNTIPVAIGTVVLIVGIAVFGMGSPADYNALTDAVGMVALDTSREIEDFYNAFRSIDTPLGSGWLGKFSTSPYTNLIFGPDSGGKFLYFYLSGDGLVGYVGYSSLDCAIKEHITEPDFPPKNDLGTNTAQHLCYHTDVFLLRQWLQESIEHYIASGTPLPFHGTEPSQVYTFSEDFKLTGQHFTLSNDRGETVYTIDGTAPLVTLRVLDTENTEVFRLEKQIGHALPTYRFYRNGELYGVLEKQFSLVRDAFTMEVQEGTLTLREYAGTVGHNFQVTLNGTLLGGIMDNLDLTINNLVFDNAFLVVYQKEYLPLLAAMAVMVARELARDKDGGLTNRIG